MMKTAGPTRLDELKREHGTPDRQLSKAKANSPLFADFLWDWLKTTAPTIADIYFHLDFNSNQDSANAIASAAEQNSGMEWDSMPLSM